MKIHSEVKAWQQPSVSFRGEEGVGAEKKGDRTIERLGGTNRGELHLLTKEENVFRNSATGRKKTDKRGGLIVKDKQNRRGEIVDKRRKSVPPILWRSKKREGGKKSGKG